MIRRIILPLIPCNKLVCFWDQGGYHLHSFIFFLVTQAFFMFDPFHLFYWILVSCNFKNIKLRALGQTILLGTKLIAIFIISKEKHKRNSVRPSSNSLPLNAMLQKDDTSSLLVKTIKRIHLIRSNILHSFLGCYLINQIFMA